MEFSDHLFDFIHTHKADDPYRLLLCHNSNLNSEELKFAVLQIELRKKFDKKLLTFIENPKFLFPDRSVAEQASGYLTAGYLLNFIKEGDSVADLTAGLGINSLRLAEKAKKVVAVEIEKNRCNILKHNALILNKNNIDVIEADCIEWLESKDDFFDLIFIDPARRDAFNRYVSLNRYSPDIIPMIPSLSKKCRRLLIKTSPLLDLKEALTSIPQISRFHIIDNRNECKEILLEIDFSLGSDNKRLPKIQYIGIDNTGKTVEYEFQWDTILNKENTKICGIETIKKDTYIYLPAPGIRKSGVYNQLLEKFRDLSRISNFSKLFHSDMNVSGFPGRRFRIIDILNKRSLKKLRGEKCNVITDMPGIKAEEITKKYKFIPDGNDYIICCKPDGRELMHIFCRMEI